MSSNSDQILSRTAARNPVIDQATWLLMDFLHCDAGEALALLRARSHGAHINLFQVAAAVVDADYPDGRWLWGYGRRADRRRPELLALSAA